MPRTLYEKLWDSHVVADLSPQQKGGDALLYIDRHLVHEVSSPQAFQALRDAGRRLRRPETHLAVADHAVPTRSRGTIADPLAAAQVAELEANVAEFDVPYRRLDGEGQGIVHVIGPEAGFTLPGITLVCGDSHTTTHGAFGALAFGIGASECGTVMAAQCLKQKRAKTMRVELIGTLSQHVTAKDIALAFIARVGAMGAAGYAVEYAGPGVAALSMAARMTLCNMTIEAGGRIGLIAPDETTFAYLEGRALVPRGERWRQAVAYWRTLHSDGDAVFDTVVVIDLGDIAPHVSWGTSPEDCAPITASVPRALEIECLNVASYHGGTESSGKVDFLDRHFPEVKGRHVLLLDDILDTGRTLHAVSERLVEEGAVAVHTAVLLAKDKVRAEEVQADYVGFEIGDEFVVGYGLDYNGKYRNLPYVGVLKLSAAK